MKATILLLFSVFSYAIWSQSCTGLNFNTPGTSSTCLDFDAATAGAGSAAGCAGGGFGGGGFSGGGGGFDGGGASGDW